MSEANGNRPKMYKVTVNLPEDVYSALTSLSESRGVTKTQALREAIKTEEFLRKEARKPGHKILIENDKNKYQQILFR